MKSVNSIIHTEFTFAAKIDTIEKDDTTIQSTICNTIRKCYAKMLSRCPPNPSYKGLDCFLSKALVCGLKYYKFISFTGILKVLRVSL